MRLLCQLVFIYLTILITFVFTDSRYKRNVTLQEFPVGAAFIGAGEGYVYNMVTVPYTIKLHSKQTNGLLVLMEGTIKPNEGPPMHLHLREDEAFYILEGRFRFQVGNDTIQAGKGSTVFAPRGVPHVFRNMGTGPGKILYTFTPGGIEGYFEEASRALAENPPNFQKAAVIATKYGVELRAAAEWLG